MRPKRSRGGRSAGLKEDTEDLAGEAFEDAPAAYARAAPKIGRNDPCPCGSGKKYKKCCLLEAKPVRAAEPGAGEARRYRSQSRGHPSARGTLPLPRVFDVHQFKHLQGQIC